MSQKSECKNVLIIGAGNAGKLLEKDIKKNHPLLRVVGFVDDKVQTKGKVVGKIEDIPKLLGTYKVDEIILAIPSTDGSLVRRIVRLNLKNRIPIKMIPRSQEIVTKSNVSYSKTKDLEPEDFLGRPFIRDNVEHLKSFYKGKTIFITGGAGSIGSEIVLQLLDLDVKKVVVYDNSEYLIFLLEQNLKERGQLNRCSLIVGNILYEHKLLALLKKIKPDIVFHAAAYKHVHLMNDNIDQAIYNNVIGTQRIIDAAIEAKVKLFTFISTDKVVNPTSVMGATKKICEFYIKNIQSKHTQFNIVRFGNVINSNGSALPLFERQMRLHRYITVTHRKMMRFFMSIREAAQLVIKSTSQGNASGSIYILNMGELINIYEVAECLVRSKNLIPGEDVEMRITGLRKGEKMVEELYTETEKGRISRGNMKDIFLLKNLDECPENINDFIAELEEKVKINVSATVLKEDLRRLFPSIR